MLRIVLWLAAACVVVLAVLAISRGVRFTSEPVKPAAPAPSVVEAARPAVAKAPEVEPPKVEAPKAPDLDPQMADDAAAVGMTTREPPPESAPAHDKAEQPPH